MNLKIIELLVLITMLTVLPIVQGLDLGDKIQVESTLTHGKTFIRGVALFPRISKDGNINFYAIHLYYKTLNLQGLTRGLIVFHHVEIPKNFNGYFGKFYIVGEFFGNLNF